MDGKFVENKNFTISSLINLLSNTTKLLDVHLMTLKPEKYFEDLAMLNTEYITIHYEAVKDVKNVINKIKALGLKSGISINPETGVENIKECSPLIDQVLVRSVNPGKGGQEFIPDVIEKIDELIAYRKENDLNFIISIDGGINDTSIEYIKDKDIDMILSGSYICNSDNFNNKISSLR